MKAEQNKIGVDGTSRKNSLQSINLFRGNIISQCLENTYARLAILDTHFLMVSEVIRDANKGHRQTASFQSAVLTTTRLKR